MEYELSKAAIDVINERKRQIEKYNFNAESDDRHEHNELARAAASYTETMIGRGWLYAEHPEVYKGEQVPEYWPWHEYTWKPVSPRQDLVKAAALLIAEIERLDRIEQK